MTARFWTVATIGLGALWTRTANPQGIAVDPLALPVRALLCRPNPPGPVVPGLLVVTIVEQPPDSITQGRTFTASYDTMGVAISILITMHERVLPNIDQLTAIGVEFGTSAKGVRAVGSTSSAIGTPGVPEMVPRRETLTEADIARARQLAAWLWNHRCRAAPTEWKQ